jgi:hypothetical protein
MKASPAIFAGSLLLAATPGGLSARDYVRADLYPAHVRSITFPDGLVLDETHPIVHSWWTIKFAKPRPNVVYYQDVQTDPQIEIEDLVCTNDMGESFECGLNVPQAPRPCLLFVDVSPDDIPDPVMIRCPQTIELVR